jgi:hypothetical protein
LLEYASNFREELKVLARTTVKSEYSLFYPPDVGHNSAEALNYTARKVELYLAYGKFLQDEEKDIQVNVSSSC